MATPERRHGSVTGITMGAIIVIAGIALMIVSGFWVGLIVALIGLIAFRRFRCRQVVLASALDALFERPFVVARY